MMWVLYNKSVKALCAKAKADVPRLESITHSRVWLKNRICTIAYRDAWIFLTSLVLLDTIDYSTYRFWQNL
jgi:hypothetical protein